MLNLTCKSSQQRAEVEDEMDCGRCARQIGHLVLIGALLAVLSLLGSGHRGNRALCWIVLVLTLANILGLMRGASANVLWGHYEVGLPGSCAANGDCPNCTTELCQQ